MDSSDCHIRELARVSRALAMMSKAADVLMHAATEQDLLHNICRVLVEDGTYGLSWIGYATDDGQDLRIVASQGALSGIVDPVRLFGDLPRIALTARERQYDQIGEKNGEAGDILVLPLKLDGQAIGVLALYSADKEAFDGRERRLLERLVDNIAYGIGMQRLAVDQRRAECELKESEARYRVLVETAPDAILVHCQGVVIFANTSAATLFHAKSADDLTGLRVASLVFASGAPSALTGLESEGAHCAAFEEHLQRFDGSTFTAEVTFAPIAFHGVDAHQMFIRDITRRKHVHSQLVQTAKLATLGEMAAGMAHELSQPINIIRMAAEGALLMIERDKANQDYQTGQFRLMASQAGRMAEIIDHIRIFSRKEPGAVVVYDAAATLKRAVDLMHPQLSSSGVAVFADLCKAGAMVEGRPVQLEQVIINLLTNAADAIGENNRKTGQNTPGEVTILSEKTPSLLQIVVSDNGPGICPQNLDRIFEPFFTTKEVGSGTGLGLSVSFGIITTMGGTMRAANRSGGGASFIITLPLTAKTEDIDGSEAPAAQDGARAALSPCHLLLVDDERHAARAMSDYFTELGYRVSLAYSGNQAFEQFIKDPADLVITDIRMPDGGGENLLRRLRSEDANLPIIIVTGHIGSTETLDDCSALGRLHILKKPVSLGIMAETVEKMLQQT